MEIKAEALERARKIKLVIFDVDGVMTDGGIYVGPAGELYKPFNCKDGLGITLAHRSGLRTAIITGRESKQLAYRAGELHITEVMQGHRNKRGAYKELKERQGLTDEEMPSPFGAKHSGGMFSAPKSEAGADATRRPRGRKTQGEAAADVPRHRHHKAGS